MKTGRNDPCPCGSGKKYKICCMEDSNIIPFPPKTSSFPELTSMEKYGEYCDFASSQGLPIPTYKEFTGEINEASEFLGDFNNHIADMTFESEEELKNYIENYVDEQNSAPKKEFLGLSSEQVDNILDTYIEENEDICVINNKLKYEDINDVVIITFINLFLNILEESGGNLPLTTTGNMNLKFCKEFVKRLHGLDFYPSNINSELDIPLLPIVKILLMYTGYIDLLKTRVKITPEGERVLNNKELLVDLFYDVFYFYLNEYNWLIQYNFPDESIFVQDSALFSLYILHTFGKKTFTLDRIFNLYIKAFPFIKKLDSLYFNDIAAISFEVMFIKEFCISFGILEVDISDKDLATMDRDNFKLKTTDLFTKLFKWKV